MGLLHLLLRTWMGSNVVPCWQCMLQQPLQAIWQYWKTVYTCFYDTEISVFAHSPNTTCTNQCGDIYRETHRRSFQGHRKHGQPGCPWPENQSGTTGQQYVVGTHMCLSQRRWRNDRAWPRPEMDQTHCTHTHPYLCLHTQIHMHTVIYSIVWTSWNDLILNQICMRNSKYLLNQFCV